MMEMEFQYISCYCLSFRVCLTLPTVFSFQYISCYCLSRTANGVSRIFRCISIHLMLLFIRKPPASCGLALNFNTSHVTVYQAFPAACKSIHRNFNTSHVTVYLPCFRVAFIRITHFNTSHVTVYPVRGWKSKDKWEFQYISCYCLSNELTPFYIFLRI